MLHLKNFIFRNNTFTKEFVFQDAHLGFNSVFVLSFFGNLPQIGSLVFRLLKTIFFFPKNSIYIKMTLKGSYLWQQKPEIKTHALFKYFLLPCVFLQI